MKELLLDPVVLVCSGVLVFGFIFLILAFRGLRKSSVPKPAEGFDFPALRDTPPPSPLAVIAPDTLPFSVPPVAPSPVPVVNKEMLMKVDLISQRLVDMQMILNKQLSVTSNPPASAGLAPEVLNQLIKITSTVAQQVEILQQTIGNSRSVPVSSAPTPTQAPTPTPSPTPMNLNPENRSAPAMVPVSQVVRNPSIPPSGQP